MNPLRELWRVLTRRQQRRHQRLEEAEQRATWSAARAMDVAVVADRAARKASVQRQTEVLGRQRQGPDIPAT